MGLTLVQRFGTGATIDASTPSDPILKIHLNTLKNAADGGDVVSGQGLNTLPTSQTADAMADKLFTAIFKLSEQNQPATNNSDALGVFIEAPRKVFLKRNTANQIEISYTVNFYVIDPTDPGVDPDTLA